MSRELTRKERQMIRKLVTTLCANFDREQGCLPLDGECYMLGKRWSGAYYCYFRDAVLPADPALKAALTSESIAPEMQPCPVCGKLILSDGRTRYCSTTCAETALRRQKRDHMRRKRR